MHVYVIVMQINGIVMQIPALLTHTNFHMLSGENSVWIA